MIPLLDSPRAQEITNKVAGVMIKDMRPFSVVEDVGFRELLLTLEPRYNIPCRAHFSRKVVPSLYENAKQELLSMLKDTTPSFTTDSWTSCAAQSYTTFTVHFIDASWALRSYVLDTTEDSCHTADNLKAITLATLENWSIPVTTNDGWTTCFTTDNARNAVNAVQQANLRGIGCLAHTLNLATKRALEVTSVKTLLSRIRSVVTYFHKSAKATTALTLAQEQKNLPRHKLIQDVPTRWNSTFDSLERFIEQQSAIYAVLADKDHRSLLSQLERTDEQEVENMITVLKPMKTLTTFISGETSPSASVILPIKEMIQKNCLVREDDSNLIKQMKNAIWEDFKDR